MKLNIQSINFRFRKQLNTVIEKKVEKFKRLCADVIRIEIRLTLEKSGVTANKRCGIRLVIAGYDLLSNAQSNTFEEAIAQAAEALERQIEKRKTRLKKQATLQPAFLLQMA